MLFVVCDSCALQSDCNLRLHTTHLTTRHFNSYIIIMFRWNKPYFWKQQTDHEPQKQSSRLIFVGKFIRHVGIQRICYLFWVKLKLLEYHYYKLKQKRNFFIFKLIRVEKLRFNAVHNAYVFILSNKAKQCFFHYTTNRNSNMKSNHFVYINMCCLRILPVFVC